jgi:hypothetical protein
MARRIGSSVLRGSKMPEHQPGDLWRGPSGQTWTVLEETSDGRLRLLPEYATRKTTGATEEVQFTAETLEKLGWRRLGQETREERLWRLFHHLWGRSQDFDPQYNKKLWCELDNLIVECGARKTTGEKNFPRPGGSVV